MALGLRTLLGGIYASVIEARKFVNNQHLHAFESHFEKHGEGKDAVFKPKHLTIDVPFPNGATRRVKAPYSALVPTSALMLEELTIKFQAKLTGFEDLPEGVDLDAANTPISELSDSVKIMLKGRSFWSRAAEAEVEVKFKLRDGPEGIALIEEKLLDSMR